MITKGIKDKIKSYFFFNPTTRLRVRHIEREVGVPLPSVIKYVQELETENILKRNVIAGVTTFSADRASKSFLREKRLFNIHRLFFSGFVDFLIDELSNPEIIVFGSFSKGEDVETSDIDIYVETSSNKKVDVSKFEKKLQRKIEIFSHCCLKRMKNKDLANNIINGVSLNGFVGVF